MESEARAAQGETPMTLSAPVAPRIIAALVGIAVPCLVFGRAVARTAIPYEDLVGAPDYDHRSTASLMDSLSVDAAEAAARALWERCGGARS